MAILLKCGKLIAGQSLSADLRITAGPSVFMNSLNLHTAIPTSINEIPLQWLFLTFYIKALQKIVAGPMGFDLENEGTDAEFTTMKVFFDYKILDGVFLRKG